MCDPGPRWPCFDMVRPSWDFVGQAWSLSGCREMGARSYPRERRSSASGVCPETGQPRVLRGHEAAVKHLDVSPDGLSIATAASDSSVRLWDLETGRTTLTVRFRGSECGGVSYLPDRSGVMSTWHDDFFGNYPGPGETRIEASVLGLVLIDGDRQAYLVSSESRLNGPISVAPDGSWAMSRRPRPLRLEADRAHSRGTHRRARGWR